MRFLFPLIAFVASASSAQACLVPLDVVETWTTYCDDGTERVRLTIEFSLGEAADLSESGSEFYVGTSCLNPDPCPGPDGRSGVLSDIGGGNYRFVLEGWEKSCFPNGEAVRDGAIYWRCFFEPGQAQTVLLRFYCGDRAQPIIDDSTCVPLPVSASTWGAIKAMYR